MKYHDPIFEIQTAFGWSRQDLPKKKKNRNIRLGASGGKLRFSEVLLIRHNQHFYQPISTQLVIIDRY